MGDWYISEDIPEWIIDDKEPTAHICSWDQIILAHLGKPGSQDEVQSLWQKSDHNPRPAERGTLNLLYPLAPGTRPSWPPQMNKFPRPRNRASTRRQTQTINCNLPDAMLTITPDHSNKAASQRRWPPGSLNQPVTDEAPQLWSTSSSPAPSWSWSLPPQWSCPGLLSLPNVPHTHDPDRTPPPGIQMQPPWGCDSPALSWRLSFFNLQVIQGPGPDLVIGMDFIHGHRHWHQQQPPHFTWKETRQQELQEHTSPLRQDPAPHMEHQEHDPNVASLCHLEGVGPLLTKNSARPNLDQLPKPAGPWGALAHLLEDTALHDPCLMHSMLMPMTSEPTPGPNHPRMSQNMVPLMIQNPSHWALTGYKFKEAGR